MSVSIDDYVDLSDFVCRLTRRPKLAQFREVEVRCETTLTGHRWTVYGPTTMRFTSDVGYDEEDYVTDRLIRSGLLPIEQY
jgi:hypothetical protein|nr:MAG TPA: hypothetical protein [Caudoviricetes sp.]